MSCGAVKIKQLVLDQNCHSSVTLHLSPKIFENSVQEIFAEWVALQIGQIKVETEQS